MVVSVQKAKVQRAKVSDVTQPGGRPVVWLVCVFTLLVVLLGALNNYVEQRDQWYWQDLLLTRDQQGFIFFRLGQFQTAAQRFESADWKATAYYAAENFTAAAAIWKDMPGALGHFKRANALAHMEDYAAAADGYRLALRLKPDWVAAQENLSLIMALAAKPKPQEEFDGRKATELGADEIVFSNDKKRMENAEDEMTLDEGTMSSAEINALWMRRLQSTPADFLRLKFRYQTEMQASENAASQGAATGSTQEAQ